MVAPTSASFRMFSGFLDEQLRNCLDGHIRSRRLSVRVALVRGQFKHRDAGAAKCVGEIRRGQP